MQSASRELKKTGRVFHLCQTFPSPTLKLPALSLQERHTEAMPWSGPVDWDWGRWGKGMPIIQNSMLS